MKTTLYLDCISGISGDMLLAALIDVGADPDRIRQDLLQLPIDEFDLWVDTVDKRGIAAKKLRLKLPEHDPVHDHGHSHDHDHAYDHAHDQGHAHTHRKASTILEMIRDSDLPPRVKLRSERIFRAIAVAEGKIHGLPPDDVHFHEVGAMDSIIDTIGVCLALEQLGVEELWSSPVPTGHGMVRMAHGLYPIPAPATAELLKGIPLAPSHSQGELTTPTGAGILNALVTKFGPLEKLTVEKIGYGAGTKDLDVPNVLRVLIGLATEDRTRETIHVLEAQLDDCTGEMCGYVMERLFAAGALDVCFTAVQMKKSRPGTLVTALCRPSDAVRLEELLLTETTTFGVRESIWSRRVLEREIRTVATPYGDVRVKIGRLGEKMVQAAPEYEDAARLAREHAVPFHDVYCAALIGNKIMGE